MTATTLPRVAADLDGNGHAFYAAHALAGDPDAENVIWFPSPAIPAGLESHYGWADDVDTPHLTLDLTAVAELLFAAPVDLDPDTDPDVLARLVLTEVDRWHCNLAGPIAVLAQEAGDHPDLAARRMGVCVLCAARLLGTEV